MMWQERNVAGRHDAPAEAMRSMYGGGHVNPTYPVPSSLVA